MLATVPAAITSPGPVRDLVFCRVMCNIVGLIQRSGQLDQLHKLAAVTVRVIAPGLAGQLFDVVEAEVLEVLTTTEFLSKSGHRCSEVQTVAALCVDAAIHHR